MATDRKAYMAAYYAANKVRIDARDAAHAEDIKAYQAAYRAAHKKETESYDAAYYAAHKEEKSAYHAAYRAAHKDELRAKRAVRRAAHEDEEKARLATYQAAYRAAHKEERKVKQAAYDAAHREEIRASKAAYQRANPEKYRAIQNRRRARKLEAEGTYTEGDIKAQYTRQRGKCFWCGKRVGKQYHVDHVVPLSRGGSNWPENLVISCTKCNLQKGSKMPHEWSKGGRLL